MAVFVDYSEKERGREGLCEDNRKMHTMVTALIRVAILLRSQVMNPLENQ